MKTQRTFPSAHPAFILVLGWMLACLSGMAQTNQTNLSGRELDRSIMEKLNRAKQMRGQTNVVTQPVATNRFVRPSGLPTGVSTNRVIPSIPTRTTRPSSNAPAASVPPPIPPPPAIPSSAVPSQPTAPATPQANAVPGNQPSAAGAPAMGAQRTSVAGVDVPDPDTVITPETIKMKNMDLDQVLDLYAALVQKTILRPNTLQATQITLEAQTKLTKVEAVQALDTILAMNGITVIPFGDKFVKVVPVAEANLQGAEFLKVPYENLPEADQFVTQVVQLEHALASEVLAAITTFSKNAAGLVAIDSSNVLVLRDYASNVKRMMEVIEKIDVEVIRDEDLEVIPIKYALSSDIASVLGSLTEGGVTTTGGSASRGLSTSGSSRIGSSSSSRTGSSLNNRNTTTTQNRATTPQQTAASSRSSFNNRLQQIVQRAARGSGEEGPMLGQAQIIADERTNALLVFGTKREREKVKEIVDKLDTVQPQVLIEAIIMEVSLDSSFAFGVSAAQSPKRFGDSGTGFGGFNNLGGLFPGAVTNFPSALPEGFSYFGQFGQSWDVALETIERDSNINVLSRPRVQTTHAVEASLRVGRTVPFVTGTFSDINGGGRSQFQNEFVGIELNVLPLINQDGLVVLEIAQDVAELGPSTTIDGNPVPTTTERSAQASVAVQDGETIILGGFISTTKRKTEAGVPYLKNIPLLGSLFKQKDTSDEKVELIVLIRPTVLPNPSDAAIFAKQQKESLSGVSLAELEILKEEAKAAAINRKAISDFKEKEQEDMKALMEEEERKSVLESKQRALDARKAARGRRP